MPTNRYIAPDGKTTNQGTTAYSPWPLAEVLADTKRQFAQPGDTCYLASGRYVWPDRVFNFGFPLLVRGEDNAAITFQPAEPRGRVTIDGGIHTREDAPAQNVVVAGLEIVCGENEGGLPTVNGAGSPSYELLNRPYGGVNLPVGRNLLFRHCVVRNAAQGFGLWSTVDGASLYGNVIFDNGWIADDRKHGHGIYAQNSAPNWKVIRRNILTRAAGLSVQIYGSSAADCSRFDYSENVSYDSGTVYIQPTRRSVGLVVSGNLHYAGAVDGSIAVANYEDVTAHDNVAVGGFAVSRCFEPLDVRDNLDWQTGWRNPRIDGREVPIPDIRAWFFGDGFERDRCMLVVHDHKAQHAVNVDVGYWAKPGEVIDFYDPTDLWGSPRRTVEVGDTVFAMTVDAPHTCLVGFRRIDPCKGYRTDLERATAKIATLESSLQDAVRQLGAAAVERDRAVDALRKINELAAPWGTR